MKRFVLAMALISLSACSQRPEQKSPDYQLKPGEIMLLVCKDSDGITQKDCYVFATESGSRKGINIPSGSRVKITKDDGDPVAGKTRSVFGAVTDGPFVGTEIEAFRFQLITPP